MKLWKRATGAIKDKNSIWVAKLSPQTTFRRPDLEAVIIKATSHDEHRIDYKNVQKVIQSAGASPAYLKPLVWSLSRRMEKTQSWAVALKGLMLMHGILCCKTPSMMQRVDSLPFDLSNFSDAHLPPKKVWGYNTFIRAYFAYLDQRSAFVSSEYIKRSKQSKEIEESLMEELEKLQKIQSLIDIILQIKPQNEHMNTAGLILEAMDCVIIELFDLYSKFRDGISQILLRIHDNMDGKVEAIIGLNVLQKASIQEEELSHYFALCKEIGIINASQCPQIEGISEENVQNLQRIVANGDYTDGNAKGLKVTDYEEKAIVVRDNKDTLSKNGLETVITEKWEVCAKTSNYTFCMKSLYSNRHTPGADRNRLADIGFRLAYINASRTRQHIGELLKKATSSGNYKRHLQVCASDYDKAVSAIGNALIDLNSETFFELADLAGTASRSAHHCEATFEGTHKSPLTFMNNDLKGLCEICVVISKLFTGSSYI
ncbi:putative clathrin assembly protein [Senna tora]|uniref:Putative clathrin assembly protein n=1 Tax=Senna tora TaxID=362788 RepID=A0A834WLJ9_9FABA|nr:putative clathrin assembly protein [Senna tora]